MIARITRIVTLAFLMNVFLTVYPSVSEGSSPKLFPASTTESQKTAFRQTKPQPNMLQKMTAGTQRFFSNIGSAIGLKKSAPPQKTMPTNPWIKPQKEEPQKSSWLTSVFPQQEPKKPDNPSEWLEQKRMDP
jgi:hypothetical protein